MAQTWGRFSADGVHAISCVILDGACRFGDTRPSMKYQTMIVGLFAIACTLSGCAQHEMKSAPVGFLSQPQLMTKGSGESWSYQAAKTNWSSYTGVYVAPVAVAAGVMEGGAWGNESDLPALATTFQLNLTTAMSAKYAPAPAPAPNVLVVRAQIIKAKPNSPARNIAPQTQIGGTGYGFGMVAIEVVDGGTGTVLYEFADVEATTRFSLEKMSVWGSLEKSFQTWSTELAKTCGGS